MENALRRQLRDDSVRFAEILAARVSSATRVEEVVPIMPKWAKWTLGAFGLLVVLSITVRTDDQNTPGKRSTYAAPRPPLDGEALFRTAEHDVDAEMRRGTR
jgi:hypothetical protein